MKFALTRTRLLWLASALLLGGGVLFAFGVIEHSIAQSNEVASLLPEGALLSIEATNFNSVLQQWNGSAEKRSWIASNDYSAFSRSRLFERLSQAQDEFASVATISLDSEMLARIAGKQSALALYDIGKLEFVYVTRLDSSRVESLPLWQARGKFEHRNASGADFFLRRDTGTGREAAFGQRNGWLVLGTREDLVAGVLDRIAGKNERSLAREAWYVNVSKQAAERGDLRMVLNLDQLVPSDYFRSYWVQRNITEMKQYSAAISDLHLTGEAFHEERVLLRRDPNIEQASDDVHALYQLAPEDSVLTTAHSAANAEQVLAELREDQLDLQSDLRTTKAINVPTAATEENVGNSSQLDVSIDQAPLTAAHTDPLQPLAALLQQAGALRTMRCYTTTYANNGIFASIHKAMVIEARSSWNEEAVRNALTTALADGTTVNRIGTHWTRHAGDYLMLDGALPLFLKVAGRRIVLTSNTDQMEAILARANNTAAAGNPVLSYEAIFRPARGRDDYLRLMRQLDHAGIRNGSVTGTQEDADRSSVTTNGEAPSFFTHNAGSLTRTFLHLESEQISERDLGAKVLQSVVYQWAK